MPEPKRQTTTRLYVETSRRVKAMAAFSGRNMADTLDDLVQVGLADREREYVARLASARKPARRPSPDD
jgi:hypothetical protein